MSQNKIIGKQFEPFKEVSIEGKTYSNGNLMEKVSLINFGFKDCAPCVAELEAMNNLCKYYKNNIKFQLISFSFDDTSTIKSLIKQYQLQFDIIPISMQEGGRLSFNFGYPTNMIIDINGKIVYIKSGGSEDIKQANKYFEKTLRPIIKELLEKKTFYR